MHVPVLTAADEHNIKIRYFIADADADNLAFITAARKAIVKAKDIAAVAGQVHFVGIEVDYFDFFHFQNSLPPKLLTKSGRIFIIEVYVDIMTKFLSEDLIISVSFP